MKTIIYNKLVLWYQVYAKRKSLEFNVAFKYPEADLELLQQPKWSALWY